MAEAVLDQRLAAYDRKRHGGERMATPEALGAERWSHPVGALSNALLAQVCDPGGLKRAGGLTVRERMVTLPDHDD